MEILILTGKFGMGHWSAALSIQEQLEREGHQAQVVDFFAYALPETAPALYRGFNLLVTYGGGIYNLFHRMKRNAEGGGPPSQPVYPASGRPAGRYTARRGGVHPSSVLRRGGPV